MKWELLRQGGDVPLARSSHTVSQIGPKLFLFGGEHDPRTPINSDVHAYDVASGDWSVLRATGTAPEPRLAHSATVADNTSRIYVFGGRSGKEMGDGAFDDLHVFDASVAAWHAVTDAKGPAPAMRSFHTSAAAHKNMYIFGGCGTDGRLADLHQFDTRVGSMLVPVSAGYLKL